jgi:hypothetical protein
MGSRSKLIVVTAGSAAFAARALSRARRRARLAGSTKGIAEVIMPSVVEETPSAQQRVITDESHAPGHQHLTRREMAAPEPEPVYDRPFAKHQRGFRHPGRR